MKGRKREKGEGVGVEGASCHGWVVRWGVGGGLAG